MVNMLDRAVLKPDLRQAFRTSSLDALSAYAILTGERAAVPPIAATTAGVPYRRQLLQTL